MSTHAPSKPRPVQHAQVGGEKVARSDGFEWLARAGFVARGVIYGIIGVLAVKLAVGAGGKTTNQQGAMRTIAEQPFGKVLLILVAIGLAGYALWRLIRALLGHGPEDSDSGLRAGRRARQRDRLRGSVRDRDRDPARLRLERHPGSTHKTTAGVLGWPAGTWLVGFAGAVLIGVGLYQGYRGLSKDFLKDSKTEQMSARTRTWIEWIGTFGHLARMVVFGLVGAFLIKAAIDYNPNTAVGLDGALAKVAHASYGPFLLGLVAAGLIAFGVYSLSDARYRRI